MNAIDVSFVVIFISCATGMIVNGAVNYGTPYNVYGNVVSAHQSYIRTPIQYGARKNNPYPTSVRRAYYPQIQARASTPVQPRTYALVRQRTYAPARPYVPVQAKAFAAQLRPMRTYAAVQPRTYAQRQPKATYPSPFATTRSYAQRSPLLVTKPQPHATYYPSPVRTITNPLVRQPMRSAVVQTPVSRTLNPKVPWYRGAALSVPYPQRYVAAARPSGVPVRYVAYGRKNNIPKTPSTKVASRNIIPGRNQHKTTQIASQNTKRTKIALSSTYPVSVPAPKMHVTRNHINGAIFPAMSVREHAQIQPNKPRFQATTHTNENLSSFLKKFKNLEDAFKGNTMKQGLISYSDDVTNKTRHRPTDFALPTRKLGSQGSPGGSKVTLRTDEKNEPAIDAKPAVVIRPGDKRISIEKNGGKASDRDSPRGVEKANSTIAVQNDAGANGVKNGSMGTNNTVGALEAPNVNHPEVNLKLLKEKVLHSNDSQFLKRVLVVLRKYTKLMKSSMHEKNGNESSAAAARPGVDLAEAVSMATSATNKNAPHENSRNASDSEHADENSKSVLKDMDKRPDDKNKSNVADESLVNALKSKSTAIKIFDMLNGASKQNSKKLDMANASIVMQKEKAGNVETSAARVGNTSKKANIETERNVGRPIFNFKKLKYGLERGNTID